MGRRNPMSRRRALAAVCLLAVLANARAVNNGFALDDEFIIAQNENVHGIDRLDDLFAAPYWPGAPGRLGLYRPLTTATYAVEWWAWEGDPTPFHVTNVLLHAGVTGLVFLLLAALVGTVGAAAGSALYAVHPVHVEAVANVVGRAELLAAAFVLLGALLYLRGGLTQSRRRLWGGAAAIALVYVLGLLSKEIAMTLPGLLLVVEAGRPGAERAGLRGYAARVRERWPVYGAVAVTLAAYFGVRASVLGTAVGNDTASYFQALSLREQWMTAVSLWPEYIRLMAFPYHLVADYSPAVRMPVTAFGPAVVLGLLVGLLAVLTGVWAWGRVRVVTLGLLWFGVAVFPVSNLAVPIGVLLAERTLYLPSVGLGLAVAGVAGRAWGWRPDWRRPLVAVVGVVVLLGAIRTWTRTPVWRSTGRVMESLVENHPESFRSQWVMANQLRQEGRLQEALELYRSAVRLAPVHYQLRMDYGRGLMEAGRHAEAVESFRAARDGIPEHPEAHVFLMAALLADHRPAEAVAAGRRGAALHPGHRGIHHQLAIALARTGDLQAALQERRISLRLGGERASWLQYLHEAELLVRLGDLDRAGRVLTRARARAPGSAAVPDLSALRTAVSTADSAVLPYR